MAVAIFIVSVLQALRSQKNLTFIRHTRSISLSVFFQLYFDACWETEIWNIFTMVRISSSTPLPSTATTFLILSLFPTTPLLIAYIRKRKLIHIAASWKTECYAQYKVNIWLISSLHKFNIHDLFEIYSGPSKYLWNVYWSSSQGKKNRKKSFVQTHKENLSTNYRFVLFFHRLIYPMYLFI